MDSKSGVEISVKDGMQIIKFKNPKKKNAISNEAYGIIQKALEDAAKNPKVVLTVFTGDGAYYSSGFDISGNSNLTGDMTEIIRIRLKSLKGFIGSIIDYPKLLIALVNGPAIGISVTTAALFDIIYASDTATFTTPFTKLGLCAEGCSSYTFPKILGKSKAAEMLLLNHKMTAQEAYQFGFVSEIFKHDKIDNIWQDIKQYAALPVNSMMATKKLMQKFEKQALHEANKAEMEALEERFMSDDFINAVMSFVTRKSKL